MPLTLNLNLNLNYKTILNSITLIPSSTLTTPTNKTNTPTYHSSNPYNLYSPISQRSKAFFEYIFNDISPDTPTYLLSIQAFSDGPRWHHIIPHTLIKVLRHVMESHEFPYIVQHLMVLPSSWIHLLKNCGHVAEDCSVQKGWIPLWKGNLGIFNVKMKYVFEGMNALQTFVYVSTKFIKNSYIIQKSWIELKFIACLGEFYMMAIFVNNLKIKHKILDL